jgi:hypothetical protein
VSTPDDPGLDDVIAGALHGGALTFLPIDTPADLPTIGVPVVLPDLAPHPRIDPLQRRARELSERLDRAAELAATAGCGCVVPGKRARSALTVGLAGVTIAVKGAGIPGSTCDAPFEPVVLHAVAHE